MYLLLVIKNARGILSYHRNNGIHRTKVWRNFKVLWLQKQTQNLTVVAYCTRDETDDAPANFEDGTTVTWDLKLLRCLPRRVGSGGSGGGVLCATWVRSVGVFFRLNWRWSSPFSKHLSSGDFFFSLLQGDILFFNYLLDFIT